MASLTVTLPEHTSECIELLVSRGAISDATTYLEDLVLQDWLRRNEKRVEDLLIEGLNSGPSTPFTSHEWDDMKQRLRDRLAAQHNP